MLNSEEMKEVGNFTEFIPVRKRISSRTNMGSSQIRLGDESAYSSFSCSMCLVTMYIKIMQKSSTGTERGGNKVIKYSYEIYVDDRCLPLSHVFIYYLFFLFFIVLLPWQNIRTCFLVATVVRIRKQVFLKDQRENYRMFLYCSPAYGTFVE